MKKIIALILSDCPFNQCPDLIDAQQVHEAMHKEHVYNNIFEALQSDLSLAQEP